MKTEQPILMYLLLTLFIGLKLTGHIAWHWIWVLAPFWGYLGINFVWGFIGGFYRASKLNQEITEGKGGTKV